jgi:hypothetical protein
MLSEQAPKQSPFAFSAEDEDDDAVHGSSSQPHDSPQIKAPKARSSRKKRSAEKADSSLHDTPPELQSASRTSMSRSAADSAIKMPSPQDALPTPKSLFVPAAAPASKARRPKNKVRRELELDIAAEAPAAKRKPEPTADPFAFDEEDDD